MGALVEKSSKRVARTSALSCLPVKSQDNGNLVFIEGTLAEDGKERPPYAIWVNLDSQ